MAIKLASFLKLRAINPVQSSASVSVTALSRPHQPMASVAIGIGLIWGITNPFIARGARIAGALPARSYTGELGWWRAGAPGVHTVAAGHRCHRRPTPLARLASALAQGLHGWTACCTTSSPPPSLCHKPSTCAAACCLRRHWAAPTSRWRRPWQTVRLEWRACVFVCPHRTSRRPPLLHFSLSSLGSTLPPAALIPGVSLAANAVFDHLLGDRLSSLSSGVPGLLLVFTGVTLCTLDQQQQVQRHRHQA